MHDMNTIRDAVSYIDGCVQPDSTGVLVSYPVFSQKAAILAAFVRDLTDETPLTVESLVRECSVDTQTFGHRTLFFRGFHVRLAEKWEWFFSSMEPIPDELQPRTVGDLRRLQYQLERDVRARVNLRRTTLALERAKTEHARAERELVALTEEGVK